MHQSKNAAEVHRAYRDKQSNAYLTFATCTTHVICGENVSCGEISDFFGYMKDVENLKFLSHLVIYKLFSPAICFVAIYTHFFLRKKEPKIVCVEKITNLRFDKMQQDQRPLDVLIAFLN